MEKNAKKVVNGKISLVTFTFKIPLKLKNTFKSKVAAEGRASREVIEELMENYINKSKGKHHD